MNVQERLLNSRIDPHLTNDSLSTLASRALGVRVRVSGYRVLTGGCWNRVVAVVPDVRPDGSGSSAGLSARGDNEIVLKISPRSRDQRLKREFRVLSYFAEHTAMPVPEPLMYDESEEVIPGSVLAMTLVPGEVMHHCYAFLNATDRDRISGEIAEYVTELHRARGRGFGGVELDACERCARWSDFWLPRFDAAVEDAVSQRHVESTIIDEIRELRRDFASALDIGGESTLTHYDVWSGNVMIDRDSRPPRVSGFIDIPGFFADYARELSFMMMFGLASPDFFKIYRTRHTLDPDFLLRVHMYNLKMHLKHISMYPSESYYRDGVRRCLDYLRTHVR